MLLWVNGLGGPVEPRLFPKVRNPKADAQAGHPQAGMAPPRPTTD